MKLIALNKILVAFNWYNSCKLCLLSKTKEFLFYFLLFIFPTDTSISTFYFIKEEKYLLARRLRQFISLSNIPIK
jgi:hypothetical protein